jgi:hypothetical protein
MSKLNDSSPYIDPSILGRQVLSEIDSAVLSLGRLRQQWLLAVSPEDRSQILLLTTELERLQAEIRIIARLVDS